MLRRAAEIQGLSLTDFVPASRTIEQIEILHLSAEDQRRVTEALPYPPAASAALQRAYQRRRQLFGLQ